MRPCAASVALDPGAESFDVAFVEAVAGDRRAATAQRGRRAPRSAASSAPIEQQLRAHVIVPAIEREQLSAVTASPLYLAQVPATDYVVSLPYSRISKTDSTSQNLRYVNWHL
jgi:hypothetical protein